MVDETLRTLSAAQLKDKQRSLRDDFESGVSIRVHRAISWLQGAERVADTDRDLAFICYWIAFNAAYVQHATAAGRSVAAIPALDRANCRADDQIGEP